MMSVLAEAKPANHPATRQRSWRLGNRLRKTLLLLHILAGGTRFGLDVAMAVLVFTAIGTNSAAVRVYTLQPHRPKGHSGHADIPFSACDGALGAPSQSRPSQLLGLRRNHLRILARPTVRSLAFGRHTRQPSDSAKRPTPSINHAYP
jgi:hypothetical protein